MVSVIVAFSWAEAFPVQCAAITPKAREIFANFWCPVSVIDGSENCPLHVPELDPGKDPCVLVESACVCTSIPLEFSEPVHCDQITSHRNIKIVKIRFLKLEL